MFTQKQPQNAGLSPALANARIGLVLASFWYCSMGWLATFFAESGKARVWEGPATTGIVIAVLLLIWRGHWRWGARLLVASAIALTFLLAWLDAFQPTVIGMPVGKNLIVVVVTVITTAISIESDVWIRCIHYTVCANAVHNSG